MVILHRVLCNLSKGMTGMDEGDQRLMAELRRDGRATLSELAARLAVSRATVRARMVRLTARAEIAAFAVVLRSDTGPALVRGV